ncbi:MAG: hypothetical protein GY805_27340 [Chloroflexi bacterium]|nr:hypothetical protein [Chloroflexota bacterium]
MKTQSKNQGLVWGSLLIFFGIVGLIEMVTDLTAWAWVAVLAVAGLGIFGIYLNNRSEWGLLIPTYVMWAVAALIGLIKLNILQGELIAPFVLTTIALPFLVGYLRNREQWGLLIPAYVLLAVGVMVWLIEREILNDLLIPAYVMFAVAIPFFVVYGRNSQQWWALIPGGIMTVIGLSFLIAEAAAGYIVPAVLILAGIWILVRQRTHSEPPAEKLKSG